MNKFTSFVMCIKLNLHHKLHCLVFYPNFSSFFFFFKSRCPLLISHSAYMFTSLGALPGLFLAAVCYVCVGQMYVCVCL